MDGYNLSTVLKRLEAAASRLEDIVVFSEKKDIEMKKVPSGTSASGASALSAASLASEHVSPRTSVRTAERVPVSSQQIVEMPAVLDALTGLDDTLAEFVKLSEGLDSAVGVQAAAFRDAVNEMLKVVEKAVSMRKPSLDEFPHLLQAMGTAATKVDELRAAAPPSSQYANHLATVAAGAPALSWVAIEGKGQAANFVQEIKDSAMFYANRVLKDNKDARPWVDAFVAYLDGLKAAVARTCPDGLTWNVSPDYVPSATRAAEQPAASASAADAPASGGAPPPAPPPPSVDQLTANLGPTPAAAPAAGGGLSGVFSELSKGESIASSLKPSSRATLKNEKPPVPRSAKPKIGVAKPKPKPAAAAAETLKPRVERVDQKWFVEDLRDQHDVEIAAEFGQSIQIDNCANCTIKITGKAATFSLSRSRKVGLLVESMVASCDVVNSTDFGIQVTGHLPSLMIDQSANGSIYLSEESVGLDIFTSQSTAINVNIPDGAPGAFRELSLGEQIVHNIVDGQVRSQVVKHA